jgi:hypothetical protein
MALNAETTERNKSRYRGLVPFQKGKSGNPGGRTKQFAQCQRLCREASPDAARRLIELMQSEDERVALMAADKVYERAWGKPKDYDPNQEAPKKAAPFDPKLYTTDELRRMQEVMTMIAVRQGLLPPEAISFPEWVNIIDTTISAPVKVPEKKRSRPSAQARRRSPRRLHSSGSVG